MRYVSFIFLALTGLSSCIKTIDAPICPNPPAAPLLASNNISVPVTGGYIRASIISPDSRYTYSWIGPNGIYQKGSALNYYYNGYGTSSLGAWSVVAQNGSALCASDSTRFTVNISIPSCAGVDSFQMSNFGTVQLAYAGSSLDGYGDYRMRFAGGLDELDIYFSGKPYSSGTFTTTYDPGSVYSGYCYIMFIGGNGNYTSNNNSTVYVTVINSTINISFCNTALTSSINSANYSASANVTAH